MILNKDYAEWAQKVVDGDAEALPCYGELLDVKKYIESCIEAVKDAAMSEADRYSEKSFQRDGFAFSKTEGRRIFKFDHIEAWAKTQEGLREIEANAKAAADKYSKKMTMVDENGAVITPAVVVFSKPSLSAKRV